MEQGATLASGGGMFVLTHEAFERGLGHLYGDAYQAGRILGCVFRKKVKTEDVDWESRVPRS